MTLDFRHYLTITANYWAFTLTDGAIRMLVILYFHQLGYSPLQIASLFIFYEFFGVVTNLIGGWIAARMGLKSTLVSGTALQIMALLMLTVPETFLSAAYVMIAQAMSGIAKDLNKMSAKSSVKLLVKEGGEGRLFKWVAVLTGSKNTLKGAGFFLGAALLSTVGFRYALFVLAGMLVISLAYSAVSLPSAMGRAKGKPKFTQLFSNSADINWLSAARLFLFGARDIWFVIGLPVFLSSLGWSFNQVGGFLALWIIGYGIIQASAPKLLQSGAAQSAPDGKTAMRWVGFLVLIPAAIAFLLSRGYDPTLVVIIGLILFGIVFAINSAVHSYLILSYSDHNKVSMNVGFYYMANAGGRLLGTILSGWIYQQWGMQACLYWSSGFLLLAAIFTLQLTRSESVQ